MMRIGVDYYPEQWDRSLWEPDAKLMREAGVTIVRLAEFAWCRLEPEEGRFDFGWLDEAVALFHCYGIGVVLGTPTATPPNWLVEHYPDVLPVDEQLHPQYPGIRGHRCYNSPSLSRLAAVIVDKLASRYADNPAVIGWQTDNEFGLIACHCPSCNEKFRAWLQRKYGTLEALNREWGTVVWSGEYSEWTQVKTPLGGSKHHNPSYLLDYNRFQIDSAVAFQQLQVDILRAKCPKHWITHNLWSYPSRLDYYKLCETLDFASFDYYPHTSPDKTDTSPYSGALSLDLVRGVKRKNFWIMEQLSGSPGCWFPMWRMPYPGYIRAASWQSISRGADAVVHFRWRSAISGAEQFWHGLIDHSNVPGRRFREFSRLADEVNRLSELLDGTTVRNEAAILFSHEQHIALDIQPQVSGMHYFDNVKTVHKALTKLGIGVDVINWTEPLNGYKLVIAPSLYLLDRDTASRLAKFAASGGTLVLMNRTGVKNLNNVCWMEPLPGPLAECAGVTVAEYDPIGEDVHRIRSADGASYEARQWADLLSPVTAEPIAWYADDYFAGTPAVTANRYGQGAVYYIGTNPEEAYFSRLFGSLADELEIVRLSGLPEGVQVSCRSKEGEAYLFIINFTREEKEVELGREYVGILSGGKAGPVLRMAPYDVEIVRL